MSTTHKKTKIIQVSLTQTAKYLKERVFLWLVTEEEVRLIWRTRGIWCAFAVWSGGATWEEMQTALSCSETPQVMNNKETGCQSSAHRQLNSASALNALGNRFLSRAPRIWLSPAVTLWQPCGTMSREPAMLCQTSDVQNHKLINGCLLLSC